MLGVSISFWDLKGSDDLVSTSILTGFAVLSENPGLSPRLPSVVTSIVTASSYQSLLPYMLFHPPPNTV